MKASHQPVPAGLASRLLVLVAALLQIVTPMLPSLGIGEPIGSQSDETRTLITPAGWAFPIWSALYTGSILFAIYQLLPNQSRNPLLARIRMPAAGAFLGNAVWAVYTQLFGLGLISAAIIVFTLVNLLTIYRRLSRWDGGFSAGEQWLVMLPLSALASWLTAATIVNIAASLRFHGVEGGVSAPLIAAGVVVAGGIIAAAALLRTGGNPPFALVFLWGLAALYAAGGQVAQVVALATGIAAVLVIIAAAVGLRRGGATHWLASRSSRAVTPG